MNKDKITAMCLKVSNETGLTFNSVMTYYFLESVLRKLSISKYNDKFIFKGGYILSNLVGLDSRSTVDIDFLFKNMPLTEELLVEIFDDILEYNEKDSIQYELKGIQEIKKQDEYGGYRIQILCKLDNIRQIVPLDIATGDILTYKPVDYEYKTIFSEDNLKIKAYNLETMLAEKLATIYSKGFLNSRGLLSHEYTMYIRFNYFNLYITFLPFPSFSIIELSTIFLNNLIAIELEIERFFSISVLLIYSFSFNILTIKYSLSLKFFSNLELDFSLRVFGSVILKALLDISILGFTLYSL